PGPEVEFRFAFTSAGTSRWWARAGAVDDAALGRGDLTAEMNDLGDRLHAPGFAFHRPHVVHLDLQGGVAASFREERVDGASHRRIEQRRRQAAVDHADGVVVELLRLDGED